MQASSRPDAAGGTRFAIGAAAVALRAADHSPCRRSWAAGAQRRSDAAMEEVPAPMNVLVTGGAGYIGSVIVEALIARGHGAVVVDNLSKGHRHAVVPPARLLTVDLADRAAL